MRYRYRLWCDIHQEGLREISRGTYSTQYDAWIVGNNLLLERDFNWYCDVIDEGGHIVMDEFGIAGKKQDAG
jgi:hypothetical protein